jgi:hypothetical protein
VTGFSSEEAIVVRSAAGHISIRVAAIAGSIGLIAAAPVTTALAALLTTRLPPAALADEHAGHVAPGGLG